MIVTSMLGFFIHHLSVELYNVPWTFILLISVSCFTIASFIVTSILHYQRSLKPLYNIFVNSFLNVLWMLGFGLLVWNLSGTLSNRCDIDNWDSEAGVMVCRIYKALTAFATVGMLATMFALVLDIRAHLQQNNRGTYDTMGNSKPIPGLHPGLHSENYREPSLEFPEYSHEAKKPYKAQRPIEAQRFGYSAPSEQTAYDGYGGTQLYGAHDNRHEV